MSEESFQLLDAPVPARKKRHVQAPKPKTIVVNPKFEGKALPGFIQLSSAGAYIYVYIYVCVCMCVCVCVFHVSGHR